MNTETLKKVLKYTTYIDKFEYHNQIINFLDKFYKKDTFPKKLINFDLHSDVKIDSTCLNVNIANWVNHIFNRYNIDEYYWVVPKHVLNNEEMTQELFYDKSNSKTFSGNYTDKDYTDLSQPLKHTFHIKLSKNKIKSFIDVSEEEMQEELNSEPDNFRLVTIYTCTADNLPDFIDNEVIVTVDGDYFSNNGYDTKKDYEYSPENIQQDFDNFIQTLSDKNIYPSYLALCISNNYTSDIESTKKFFDDIILTKNIPVKLNIEYTYTDLHDNIHEYIEGTFITNYGYIEFVLKDNDDISDDEIIAAFDFQNKNLENGVYNFGFYAKYITDENGNSKLSIYKHKYSLEKIAEHTPELVSMLTKSKNKIKLLLEKLSSN